MSFNLEDKIKWSELSPSLQNKFKIAEGYKGQLINVSTEQTEDSQFTIDWTAPSSKENNKNLWIDEKLRIARAFTENYWEFTRAAWATSGMTPQSPTTSTPKIPDISGGTSTLVTYNINYFTEVETGSSSATNRTYGSALSNYRKGTTTNANQEALSFYGKQIVVTISTSAPSMSNNVLIGYLIYTINGVPGAIGIYTGSDQTINLNKSDTLKSVSFLCDLETKLYSFRSHNPNLYPVDQTSTYWGLDFETTTVYKYYFNVAKYVSTTGKDKDSIVASDLSNMERGTIGKSDPPFTAINGTVKISVDISYTGY